mgnify:CR=1 FL=1
MFSEPHNSYPFQPVTRSQCTLEFNYILGGNQRELARAKNLKKQQDQKKAKPEGKLLDRRER